MPEMVVKMVVMTGDEAIRMVFKRPIVEAKILCSTVFTNQAVSLMEAMLAAPAKRKSICASVAWLSITMPCWVCRLLLRAKKNGSTVMANNKKGSCLMQEPLSFHVKLGQKKTKGIISHMREHGIAQVPSLQVNPSQDAA